MVSLENFFISSFSFTKAFTILIEDKFSLSTYSLKQFQDADIAGYVFGYYGGLGVFCLLFVVAV